MGARLKEVFVLLNCLCFVIVFVLLLSLFCCCLCFVIVFAVLL